MTVRELTEELKKYHPETPIILNKSYNRFICDTELGHIEPKSDSWSKGKLLMEPDRDS